MSWSSRVIAAAGHVHDVFFGAETFLLAGMCHGGAGCIRATADVNGRRLPACTATGAAPKRTRSKRRSTTSALPSRAIR
jgi:dihydrodipicolinate synthase/N-acetylneuraminate lyase